jgi:hypothetical protein
MAEPERQYCIFMDGTKYNRNSGCRAHDNAYGIHGGGGERDRWRADFALFRHMRSNGDPLAPLVLYFTLVYGWFFFNYQRKWLWRGQLIRKINPRYGQD